MQCSVRPMAETKRISDTLPKKGKVTEVCKEWLVHEDGALAYALQQQEVERHYHNNKSRNAVLREDFPLALNEQKREYEDAVARYQREAVQQEEKDAAVARRLAEEYATQEEIHKARLLERDAVLAQQIQERIKTEPAGDINTVGLPLPGPRPPTSLKDTRREDAFPRAVRHREEWVIKRHDRIAEVPLNEPRVVPSGSGALGPSAASPSASRPSNFQGPGPSNGKSAPVRVETIPPLPARGQRLNEAGRYPLAHGDSLQTAQQETGKLLTHSRNISSVPLPGRLMNLLPPAGRTSPMKSERSSGSLSPTSGVSTTPQAQCSSQLLDAESKRFSACTNDERYTPAAGAASTATQAQCSLLMPHAENQIFSACSSNERYTPDPVEDPKRGYGQDSISRLATDADAVAGPSSSREDEDAISVWPPPPSTQELGRHQQELEDEELARQLQEALSAEDDQESRDRAVAIEAQDLEIAKMLQDKERAKARRARERAKAKAQAKREAEASSSSSIAAGSSSPVAEDTDEIVPAQPEGLVAGVGGSLVPNIAAAIDPTFSRPARSPSSGVDLIRASPHTTPPAHPPSYDEEDTTIPYFPVQGQKRTSSLDKKKKNRSKDSGCKQQ